MEPNAAAEDVTSPEAAAWVDRALAEADRLEAAGDPVAALAGLAEANRRLGSAQLERRLVALREVAFERSPHGGSAPRRGDPAGSAPVDPALGLPSVPPEALDARVLADSLAAHGVLVCPGLLAEKQAEAMREAIDRAFADRIAFEGGALEESPWFRMIPEINPFGRTYTAPEGMYLCDSPRGLSRHLEILREGGILDLLRARLGDEVALMPDKCVMRRVANMAHDKWKFLDEVLGKPERVTTWHQDAPIIGAVDAGPSVVDVWVTLTPCGRDAPGLGFVRTGLDRLIPTADGKPIGPIVEPTIRAELPGVDWVYPTLSTGDAVFFDQFTVHGTSFLRTMQQTRYSVEGWFFSGCTYPLDRPGFLV